jgi:hypothetical protein
MYNLHVIVNGRPVRKFYDESGQVWVEARDGSIFEVKISNDSCGRILAIPSIDGLNVIDGNYEDPCNSRGYIVNSHSSITIPGWKINSNQAREFYFTIKNGASYVEKVGADKKNIGIIAAAIYTEKLKYNFYHNYCYGGYNVTDYIYYPISSTSDPIHTVSCSSDYKSYNKKNIATGSGRRTDFKTLKSDFNREVLNQILTILYDTWEGLKKSGIIDYDRKYRNESPQPFPSYSTKGEYCIDI